LKLSKLDWFTVLSSSWFQSNNVFMKKEFLNGSVFALWYTRPLELLMTLFSTMFCDIKFEYCLDLINLFGLALYTKSEVEIAGVRPSTTLNINVRRCAVLLFSSIGNSRSISILVMQPGSHL
jgi:hypothetical protein